MKAPTTSKAKQLIHSSAARLTYVYHGGPGKSQHALQASLVAQRLYTSELTSCCTTMQPHSFGTFDGHGNIIYLRVRLCVISELLEGNPSQRENLPPLGTTRSRFPGQREARAPPQLPSSEACRLVFCPHTAAIPEIHHQFVCVCVCVCVWVINGVLAVPAWHIWVCAF